MIFKDPFQSIPFGDSMNFVTHQVQSVGKSKTRNANGFILKGCYVPQHSWVFCEGIPLFLTFNKIKSLFWERGKIILKKKVLLNE